MAFIQLGWVSRVDEMILARERSGFAGKKVWDDIPVVAAASDAHVDVFPGADVSHSLPHPTSDVPTTEVPTDVPSVGAPTGPSPVSPGSTTVPTSSSVPVAETIPANSGTTPETPLSPIRDARKGKGVVVEEPTPTYDKTFKQLEEERLARQMSHDFEITEDQRKRQQEVLASAVKNQGPAVYSTGWTMAQVRKLSPEQLQEEFDKIQRAVAFTRGLIRDGILMSSASSKKLKTGDDEANVEAPSHGVPQEEETTIEDVDASSNLASTAQHTASSLKKVGTKKKRLGRKGVHTSQSTIQISEGDLEAAYKVCIKYASDADSAYDDDTHVNLYVVVD
ncbi:hypothetical protein Tco_1110277 [Tanacetum coccineum]|uniref:Uncharacterized protein n=1 Tax=Tanacetum coccineum TaxID=301880 RepID=A0ABQ5IKW1_9ASTR